MSYHLPPADQPDNYGGNHRDSQIRWVAIEPGTEVSRVLFLGICLGFHYFLTVVVFPKFGLYFSRVR